MQVHDVEQNSEKWFGLRGGLPTASAMKELFTANNTLPKKVTQSILSYAAELAGNVVAGYSLSREEGFQGNFATRRGHELEETARAEYEFIANLPVTQTGFVTNHNAGCSPDSFVGDHGLLEIKCLLGKAHALAVTDISERVCPRDYYVQCQAQTWICERKWCDLYFYHPVLPSAVFRVEADPDFHELLRQQVELVCRERDRIVEALRRAA